MRWRGTLRVTDGTVTLIRSSRGGGEAVADAAFADSEQLATVVGLVLGGDAAARPGRLRIEVGRPHVQLRTLDRLPPVSERELQAMVRTQARRFFRLGPGAAVTDALWLPSDEGPREARAAAVEGAWLETLVEHVGCHGHGIDEVVAVAEPLPRELRLETLAMRGALTRRRLRRGATWAAIAALAWIGAGGAYVVDLLTDRASIEAELLELEGPLARLRAIRQRIRDFEPIALAVRQQGVQGAWATETLAHLAALLPADAHLRHLQLEREGAIRMVGVFRDPPHVMRALDELERGAPALEGPPLQMGPGGAPWYEVRIVMEGDR